MAHNWNRMVRLCRLIASPIVRREYQICQAPNILLKLDRQVPSWIAGRRTYARSAIVDTSGGGLLNFDEPEEREQTPGRGALWDNRRDDSDECFQEDDAEQEALRKKHRADATDAHGDSTGLSFADLNLDPRLLERLDQLGYKNPFEIQIKTLHHTLNGSDVIGRAVTGSGKTLAFAIPIVQKLLTRQEGRSRQGPKAIVIAPTRELANQIYRSIQELHPSVRCVVLYGGDSMIRQENALRRGVDVICATPGRLNDHILRGNVRVNAVEFLCLDEADELLTPNFKMQLEDVLQSTPPNKQMMMFSATMEPEVRQLAQEYMREPVFVDLAGDHRLSNLLSVEHLCMKALPNRGLQTVEAVIRQYNPERSIVFLKTKVLCNAVAQFLENVGLQAQAIHSDLTQSRREKIMHRFRLGLLKVLCATDVAARGLDIPEVELVIQAEPPANGVEYYVHRSGRTGRAGRKGRAVLIHSGSRLDKTTIYQIEKLVDLKHVPPPETTGDASDQDFQPRSMSGSAFGGDESRPHWQQGRPFSRHRDDYNQRPRNNYMSNSRYNSRNSGYGQRQRYNQQFQDDDMSDSRYNFRDSEYGQSKSYGQNRPYGSRRSNDSWWSEDTERQDNKDFRSRRKQNFDEE